MNALRVSEMEVIGRRRPATLGHYSRIFKDSHISSVSFNLPVFMSASSGTCQLCLTQGFNLIFPLISVWSNYISCVSPTPDLLKVLTLTGRHDATQIRSCKPFWMSVCMLKRDKPSEESYCGD